MWWEKAGMAKQGTFKKQNVYNSVDELAEELGISRASTYKALRNGELPSLRIGKRFIVPRAAIRELFRHPGAVAPAQV
jgi:excisionase family DNA binding protein